MSNSSHSNGASETSNSPISAYHTYSSLLLQEEQSSKRPKNDSIDNTTAATSTTLNKPKQSRKSKKRQTRRLGDSNNNQQGTNTRHQSSAPIGTFGANAQSSSTASNGRFPQLAPSYHSILNTSSSYPSASSHGDSFPSASSRVLVSKHPPPRLDACTKLHEKGDFTVFIKSGMNIMSVVRRAVKQLDYIKEKKLKRSGIYLKALGKAIDIAVLVGVRLQQMGYFLTFTSSTENVTDEMTKGQDDEDLGQNETQQSDQVSVDPTITKEGAQAHNQSHILRVRQVAAITIEVQHVKEEYIGLGKKPFSSNTAEENQFLRSAAYSVTKPR